MILSILRQSLQNFPKFPISNTPSPLEPLTQLKAILEMESMSSIWIKRDDEICHGFGGNKGRKLAYLLADAIAQNKHKVATFGGLQSNHMRMTAASCAPLALKTHLFFFDRKPSKLTGNLILNDFFDAKMHFIPFGGGNSNTISIETTNRIVHLISMLLTGTDTYFIPVGGHSPIGCLGYIDAACEIVEQVEEVGLDPSKTSIVTAVGTGGTLAGLLAGFRLLDSPIRVLGIDIGNLWKGFSKSIAHLATNLCILLGSDEVFQTVNIPLIEGSYVGHGYAKSTDEGWQAIRLLAQSEGILLDPVYTGKAFAGMLDLIQKRQFGPHDNLIFLHSGGFPALWA